MVHSAATAVSAAPLPLAAGAPALALQAVIDQTLGVVWEDSRRLATVLGTSAALAPSLEELRSGPLGQDLRRLAQVAGGQTREPQDQVLMAIGNVLQLLFWPAGADTYLVPRPFWTTDLGRLLARAKFRAFAAEDLVGIGAAARRLGVTRPTIYRWMDDGSLEYVRDDRSGRSYVLRHGVDGLQRRTAVRVA